MSVLKRLWAQIARFAEALKRAITRPATTFLGKRVDKLERDGAPRKATPLNAGGGGIQL
jgi:hypothetical protein